MFYQYIFFYLPLKSRFFLNSHRILVPLPKEAPLDKIIKFLNDNIHKEARAQEAITKISEFVEMVRIKKLPLFSMNFCIIFF